MMSPREEIHDTYVEGKVEEKPRDELQNVRILAENDNDKVDVTQKVSQDVIIGED